MNQKLKIFKNVIFYFLLGVTFLGLVCQIKDWPGKISLIFLGLSGLFIFYSVIVVKKFVKGSFKYQILIWEFFLGALALFLLAKYLHSTFLDIVGMVLMPLFFLYFLLLFFKSKFQHFNLVINSILFIFLSLPLFGLLYPEMGIGIKQLPRQYIPQWYNRYNIADSHEILLTYNYKSEEAKYLKKKADSLTENKNYYAALLIYQQIQMLEPENPSVLFDLSAAYAFTNNLEKAVAILDKAIAIDSTISAFYNNRGLLHYKLDNNILAKTDFEKAISLDSTQAVAYANLALVFCYENNYNKACNLLTSAENLGANTSEGVLQRIKDKCEE